MLRYSYQYLNHSFFIHVFLEFLDRFYLSMQFEGMNMNNFDQDNFIEEGQLIQDSNYFV